MNEPDLKFNDPGDSDMNPLRFCKALVSAFEGVLDAEAEVGVKGPLPNLTVTMSFGVCKGCPSNGEDPALGQMESLRRAMLDPASVNYVSRGSHNRIWEIYRHRFEHSVNTANSAESFNRLFLEKYKRIFSSTPIFIAEYHSPVAGPTAAAQEKDIKEIMKLAADKSNLLSGINFFEFQVRYDKGGAEMSFGMLGLGSQELGSFSFHTKHGTGHYKVWCLTPVKTQAQGQAHRGDLMITAVSQAFEGPGLGADSAENFCVESRLLLST
jgi:hypothetical protein